MPVMPSRKPAIIRNVRLRVLLCQRILYSAATEPFQRIFEHRAGEDPVRGAGKHLNHLPSRCVARRGSAGSCGRRRLGRLAKQRSRRPAVGSSGGRGNALPHPAGPSASEGSRGRRGTRTGGGLEQRWSAVFGAAGQSHRPNRKSQEWSQTVLILSY